MKLLAVFDNYPYPLSHGQNLRVFHYAKYLSRRHVVDLIHVGEATPNPALDGLFRRSVEVTDYRWECGGNPWERSIKAFSVSHVVPRSVQLGQRIRELHDEDPIDVLWVGASALVPSLPDDLGVPLLIDECDHEGLLIRRRMALECNPLRWLKAFKRYQMRLAFERRTFRAADAVLFVSDLDRASFARNCPDIAAHVIANGVDVDFFAPNKEPAVGLEVVFEGNMSFPPNVDAVVYFVQRILPLIRRRIPEVTFTIIGRDPTHEVERLESPTVTVTGFVEDVRPHLARGRVFVCPMRRGAGIKNKILQAWAMGIPVVSTPEGTGGLKAMDGVNLLLGHSPQAFADAVVDLLTDDVRRAELGAAGRQTVLEHYTWEQRGNELETLMDALARSDRS